MGSSVIFLVLRRMRAPLIVLIVFYAIAVLGLTLVPGVNADGTPAPPLSFFHAFYFISYTATTIGFGEIPAAFSEGQRLWVTACIYMTVIAWSYSILTMLALLQDTAFQHTLVAGRFKRRVKGMRTPFYIVCGCGETGSLICRALDIIGHDFVILDKNPQRVEELDLEDFRTNDPALAADAAIPANLLMAGLHHPQCEGVLAVTNDDNCNLAVAINTRLLNPAIPVLARVRDPLVGANMASFGTHHIVNANERFAEYLALAASSPERFRLIEILTALPGTPMPDAHRPPRGRWIICGYGHFGQMVARFLALPGIDLTVVDPEVQCDGIGHTVVGRGTEAKSLEEAGVAHASGIVAGTSSDIANLSIAMMARELNPSIYAVVRQNQGANDLLFNTFRADFSMVHTQIVAQECISIITTPLLSRFLAAVRATDEAWSRQLSDRLQDVCGRFVPDIWDIRIEKHRSPAICEAVKKYQSINVGQLVRDNADRDSILPVVVLMIERQGETFLLPDDDFRLQESDAILLAGQHYVRSIMNLTVQNVNALDYVITGRDRRGGWLWQTLSSLSRRRSTKAP